MSNDYVQKITDWLRRNPATRLEPGYAAGFDDLQVWSQRRNESNGAATSRQSYVGTSTASRSDIAARRKVIK